MNSQRVINIIPKRGWLGIHIALGLLALPPALADALHDAAKAGDLEEIKQLIADGADVNEKAMNGDTPLHQAANWGQTAVVKLLLAKGADANATDKRGQTPLYWATNGANDLTAYSIAKLLIASGADVNANSAPFQLTPLHLAAAAGLSRMAALLIAHGANPDVKSRNGSTPMAWAANFNGAKVVDVLIDNGVDPNEMIRGEGTALHIAVARGREGVAARLIARGANVNVKTKKDGFTPLHLAAAVGSEHMVEILIANGADLNTKDKHDQTPLALAAQGGQNHIVELLKRHAVKE